MANGDGEGVGSRVAAAKEVAKAGDELSGLNRLYLFPSAQLPPKKKGQLLRAYIRGHQQKQPQPQPEIQQ